MEKEFENEEYKEETKERRGIIAIIIAIILLLLLLFVTFLSATGTFDILSIFRKDKAISENIVIDYSTQKAFHSVDKDREILWYCNEIVKNKEYETYMTLYEDEEYVKVFPIVGVWTTGINVAQPTSRIFYVTEQDSSGNITGQFVPEVDNLYYDEEDIEYHRIIFNNDLSILVGILKSNNGVVYQHIVEREPEDEPALSTQDGLITQVPMPIVVVPEPSYTNTDDNDKPDNKKRIPTPDDIVDDIIDPIDPVIPVYPQVAAYTIYHVRQGLDGNYGNNPDLIQVEYGSGFVGATISATPNTYEGFSPMEFDSAIINENGTSRVIINYRRNKYEITYNENNGKDKYSKEFYYEEEVTSPSKPHRDGYKFNSWVYSTSNHDVISKPSRMPARHLYADAKWDEDAAKTAPYNIKHVRQSLDGTYGNDTSLIEEVTKTGTIGDMTVVEQKTYKGFTVQPFDNVRIPASGIAEIEVKYQRNTYTIEYDDGTIKQFKYEELIVPPANPTKEHYDFVEWVYKDSNGVEISTPTRMPAENLTAEAKWMGEIVNYTVRHIRQSVDGTYGSEPALIETDNLTNRYGNTVIPTTKTYTGFTVVTPSPVTLGVDTVIDIKYKRNVHKVTFYDGDGNVFEEKDIPYEGTITEPATDPEKEGYTFDGWYYVGEDDGNKPTTMPDHPIIVQPKWKINQYTVKYYSDSIGGTLYSTKTQDYNSVIETPAINPIKVGYTFSYWKYYKESDSSEISTPSKIPAFNMVAVAQYSANPVTYTVKHIRQSVDGTYGSDSTLIETEELNGYYDQSVTISEKSYAGFTPATSNVTTVTLGENTEVELKYVRNTYRIYYVDSENSYSKSVEVKYQADLDSLSTYFPDAPSKTGYHNDVTNFVNSSNVDVGTPTNMPAYDLYYKPIWEVNNYTVTLHSNGGTGTDIVMNFEYDESKHITRFYMADSSGSTSTHFLRDGYYVDQMNTWNTEADGSGTSYKDTQTIKNLTTVNNDNVDLYAQWSPMKITVDYARNGAKETPATAGMTSHYYYYGDTGTTKKNNYTRTGYKYSIWNTKADGTGISFNDEVSFEEISAELSNIDNDSFTNPYTSFINVYLYPQWEANSYTITFNANGGTGSIPDISANYDEEYTLSDSGITKEGYTVKEWNTKADGTGTSYPTTSPVKNLSSTDGDTVQLYAIWEPITYNITFSLIPTGGVTGSIADIDAEYDVEYTFPASAISRKGYTFNKWTDYIGNNYNTTSAYKNLSSTDGDTVTLYSNWNPIEYTVKFNNNGGSGTLSDINAVYDETFTVDYSGITKTGYSLEKWNTKADGSGTDYVGSNGEGTWSNLSSTDGDEVTLYAQWSPIHYTIKFNLNGGSSTTALGDVDATYDVSYTIKDKDELGLSRAGYGFIGWNTKADGSGTDYDDGATVSNLSSTNGAEITLYAQWAQGYTVHYSSTTTGTTGTMTDTFFLPGASGTIKDNAFEVTGYHFDHWEDANGNSYDNEAAYSSLDFDGDHDIYLTASFEENSYKIVYKANGGTGADIEETHTYTESFNIKTRAELQSAYTREMYYIKYNVNGSSYYACVNTEADGTGTEYTSRNSVSGLTSENNGVVNLYVQWNPVTIRVSYNNNSGTGSMTTTVFKYGDTGNLPASTLTRTGAYEFIGWNSKSDWSGADVADEAAYSFFTADNIDSLKYSYSNGVYTVNLYAKWKATVTFYPNYPTGMTGSLNVTSTDTIDATAERVIYTVPYNGTISTAVKPYKLDGYTIKSWNSEPDGSGYSISTSNTCGYTGTVVKNYDGKLYAIWGESVAIISSTFPSSSTVTSALGISIDDIKHINMKGAEAPDGTTTYNCSTTSARDNINNVTLTSDEDIYMWYDTSTETLNYYTEASKVYFSTLQDAYTSYTDIPYGYFSKLTALEDITNLDEISLNCATGLGGTFHNCTSLDADAVMDILDQLPLDIITNFKGTFYDCTGINGDITLSGIEFKGCTSMVRMFRGATVNKFTMTNCTFDELTTMNSILGYSSTTNVNINDCDFPKLTDMSYILCYCNSLTDCSITDVSTPSLTNIKNMFAGINNNELSSAVNMVNCDLTGLDTSKVTTMEGMFSQCQKLKNLDISTWNTSSLTTMNSMFIGCIGLETLDLSNFNTSNVTNVYRMLSNCTNLKTVYASDNWDVSSQASIAMFEGCNELVGGYGFSYASNTDTNKHTALYAVINTSSADGYLTGKTSAIVYDP